ncbi:zinc finger protein 622 [Mastacembelus armatus]|uniref:Cytoplasmic 60S subunit biogenesis factor ZNF622 n=1 Tax=Mastacembelus armatus TaxID=205130 RepID=A0A3Q3SFX3_9TELE|nr:zinc finger protein 622 [Mastacembelus armatus]XP_026169534.1 zinc finger protein 622 [Mastacembelus armatus]XP_026169535.1 zinc finger protein 622 [Mastacembelus armatus]XP_026169536.1 zinc finger protein 622 [Mastacembelus armatus]
MASYTCISCRVAFADGEVQRAHYKTDWHRYNLKRKVADMPPVTAENFQERVLAQRAAAEQQLNEATVTEGCALCNKRFSSANAYQNHLQSHKHQQAEKQAVLAAQRKVEKMNEKNLEKGLGDEKADHDARNEALQQALKEQQSPAKQAKVQESQGASKPRTEKPERPPRMMWLEEQARRREKEEGAAAEEDEWEDVVEEEEEDDDEMEEDEDEEETMDQEGGDAAALSDPHPAALPGSIPVTDCLFCSHHSKSLMKNVAHMTKVHSFFIPDVEFLLDLKGLVRYLGEKVGAGNVCLWCNEKGRSFYSTEAVQSHMTDKSHCKLFTDGDAALEFADFYDFRSSYPDRKDGDDAEMGEELPDDKNLEYDDETLELTLPSGAKIGHRSLMRYYKQRFGVQRAVALTHNRNAVGRVLRQYKALGWGGDRGSGSLHQKQRDMQYVQMLKSKWMLKMGMGHNATKQKHFRAQVMF